MTEPTLPVIDRLSAVPRDVLRAAALAVAVLLGACSDDGSSDTTAAESAAMSPAASESPGTETPSFPGEPAAMPGDVVDPAAPPVEDTAASARYRVVLDASWSATTHPEGFPGNPHFSGLIGAVHSEQVRFWEPGQIASDGIRRVAETGGKAPFRDEIEAAIDDGRALALIDGPGVALSPGQAEVEIEVTRDYPELTLVTMLAPSPDWFVGVHGLSLLEDDGFVAERAIELVLYDAGTDSGVGYVSSNLPTEPRSPIARLTSAPGDSPFVDGEPIVATLRLERLASP